MPRCLHLFRLLACALVLALPGTPILASGSILLTVDASKHGGKFCELTLDDLQDMTPAGFDTTTIWTEGETAFEGVSLHDLLEEMKVRDGTLQLVAANDYFVEMPVADALEDVGLIAYHMDGEEMSRRDKGPLWLVFPYDEDVKYQSELYYSRSIWQLSLIRILPE